MIALVYGYFAAVFIFRKRSKLTRAYCGLPIFRINFPNER